MSPRLVITPPIPRCVGLVTGSPGAKFSVGPSNELGSVIPAYSGTLDSSGEFYFKADQRLEYGAHVDGLAWNETPLRAKAPKKIFNDNFKYTKSVWQLRDIKYADHITASADAVRIADGRLTLGITRQTSENHFGSGALGTQGRFDFQYGWVAGKMRFPQAQGAHGSLWLQDRIPHAPGTSEIDVVEYFGARPGKPAWNAVHSTIWYPGQDGKLVDPPPRISVLGKDIGANWSERDHVFAIHWHENGYEFWIDKKRYGVMTQGLSSMPKYLIVSMLSKDFELNDLLANYQNDHTFDMGIDWVRVWQ